MAHDEEVQKQVRIFLEHEIDVYKFLLEQEEKPVPSEETAPARASTFSDKLRPTKLGWREWIQKIFEKLNSLLGKVFL